MEYLGEGVPFYRLVHAYKTRYNAYDIWIPKEFFRQHNDVFVYNYFVNPLSVFWCLFVSLFCFVTHIASTFVFLYI